MKRIIKTTTIILMLASILPFFLFASGSSEDVDDGKLDVVASFYPMYDFAKKIGGDKVNVYNLVPAGTEPHDWEPSTKDIIRIENANVLVYNGAGLEHWTDDVLASISNKDLVVCEASKGIALHEGTDEHEGTDPHVWLSIKNAIIELSNIRDALKQADPDNSGYYDEQYQKWEKQFLLLDSEYRKELSSISRNDIVVSHEAFGYLASEYGLEQHGIEGIEPDSEPDPARLAKIEDYVKKNNVKTIFSEELVSKKVAQTIANATGANIEILNPIEGLTDEELEAGDDYLSIMKDNLNAILKALK